MQRFVLIFALAGGALALHYVGNHVKKVVTHANVHKAFHNKYTGNASVSTCPKFDSEIHNSTLIATECITSQFDPEKVSFCHFTEKKLRMCLDGPKLLLDRCMPPKSKGLPDLVFDMIFALLDFTCKAKGSQLIELTNPCITLTLSEHVPDVCVDKLSEQAEKLVGPEMSLSKSDFCELLRSFETCLKYLFNEYCTSPITIANFFKFYESMLEPCKKQGI